MLEQLVGLAARRPRLTVLALGALAVACGLLALGLEPSTGTDTFVSRSSADYQATQTDLHRFGGNAVVILIREPLTDLVESKDLGTITELEACLNGEVVVPDQQLAAFVPAPAGSQPPYGGRASPCGKLMRHRLAQVVYGPGTFLNRAVAAVRTEMLALESGAAKAVRNAESAARRLARAKGLSAAQAGQAAKAAGQLEAQQQYEQLSQLALDSGINGTPSIDDPQFIPQIVFDQMRGVNMPKARFSYLFPTRNAALIQVRLKAGLSGDQVAHAISWIRQAVAMRMFRLGFGGRYTVSGEPVVLNDLSGAVTGSIVVLLIGAVAVMALVLLLVFRGRLRLLPLVIALAAAAITFGATSLAGAMLTMASIAVLPILIGLAVDYAIQFQSRARESESSLPAELAVGRAARAGAPTIGAAALATATGFLVLLLSPVPMVRGFGVLLVVGIAVAFACTLSAGAAAIVLAERPWRLAHRGRVEERDRGARFSTRSWRVVAESARGAREILRDGWRLTGRRAADALARRLPRPSIPVERLARHPGRVLAVGLVLAAAGWVADTQTGVQSDVTKLVPSGMPALRHLRTLEHVTGVSGEIDVLVRSGDVATANTVGWMIGYENRLLSHFGYSESKGCAAATLCPALSLPDLFSSASGAGGSSGTLTTAKIRSLLSAVPAYFSQAVITRDRHYATLAFGIRLMPLSRQQRVIDYMRAQLHPPRGVSAQLAGLPVLAADANGSLSSSGRRLLTLLVGLLAVGLVLLGVFRAPRRALIPLVPIALATGWSALIVFLIGIPLNPMSATLGSLVIAISTEFSVLLSERFGQERALGLSFAQALGRAYRSTGMAVLASGLTAIAGFGVLLLSDITMLRDFGFVTVIDMSVSLAGVLLVLPAVLAVAEQGGLAELRRAWPSAVAELPVRRRRRARVA